MINYSEIINALTEEAESCNYRYSDGYTGIVPAFYQHQITMAVEALITCQESLNGIQHPPKGLPHDPYKTDQLAKMLRFETTDGQVHYGARLIHRESGAKDLTIDAGGIRALLKYYATHKTELGNGEE